MLIKPCVRPAGPPLAGGNRSSPECTPRAGSAGPHARQCPAGHQHRNHDPKKPAATHPKASFPFGATEQSGEVLCQRPVLRVQAGTPDADMVCDMRFIPNPFYVQSLKQKPGLEP